MSQFQVDFPDVPPGSSLGYILYAGGNALGPRTSAGILPADWPDGAAAGLKGSDYSVLIDTAATGADTLVWDTGGSNPQSASLPLVAPPLPVLATIRIPVPYAPNPRAAALLVTEGGVNKGPFPAAVSGPAADGVTYTLTASLTSLPAGLAPGAVRVTPGDIRAGVFVPATVNGVPVPPVMGTLAFSSENATPALPAIPPQLYSVARWRSQLRGIIRDAPLPPLPGESALDPSLATVFSDDDLDDVLRVTLPVLSVYRPVVKMLPPLSLVAGTSAYALPVDFVAPVEDTWPWLAPSAWERGDVPGSRYALLQRQSYQTAAFPLGSALGQRTFGTIGYGYYGAYAALWGDGLPVGLGPNNLLTEGGSGGTAFGGTQVSFLDASVETGGPTLLLSPPPMQSSQTPPRMAYKAAHTVRRLSFTSSRADWATSEFGGYQSAVVPLASDFADGTDVFSFGVDSDLVRLSLLYAGWWTLTQTMTSLAQSDGQKYAFFEQRSGLGRKDILSLAATLLTEFEKRTVNRPLGTRG